MDALERASVLVWVSIRKMWSLIGLHSPKGPEWANMGRAFVKRILNSSRGLHPQDNSPQAQQARRIQGFSDLDGIEFVAKVESALLQSCP
jgi:hypothetical protein